MDERYRLIFRGEVLPDHHRAVVKKRLQTALKLEASAIEQLFSGKVVVLKRDTDTKTAARLQAVFKAAGARLRVLPVEVEQTAESSAIKSSDTSPHDSTTDNDPTLLPVGSDLLSDSERAEVVESEVATDHLSVAATEATLDSPEVNTPTVKVPDTSHLTVAEVGVYLLEKIVGKAVDQLIKRISTDFELLALGVNLSDVTNLKEPEIDMADVNFDLAAVGADLSSPSEEVPPAAPDTTHITLE